MTDAHVSARQWRDLIAGRTEETEAWELFHENSKVGRYSTTHTEAEIRAQMESMWQALPLKHCVTVDLPEAKRLELSQARLAATMRARATPDNLLAKPLSLQELTCLLYYAAGIHEDRGQPDRPFRMVPSGGALYPVELFLHVREVAELDPGLYYYNPLEHRLARLMQKDLTESLSACLVQPALPEDTAIQFFHVGIFDRTVFKYSDRGYRFALLEAGHQAQNLALTATALNYGCVNVGGYRDRDLDELLGFDGLQRSVIYLTCLGTPEAGND